MLRSFRLANHRSIAGEQELLLMPARRAERSVVPVTAIYGANASGKSNLIHGLTFMRSAVLDSFPRWDVEGGVPRQPFRLSADGRSQPSVYVTELVIDGVPHVYGFGVDDDEIIEEWLYSYPEKRKRTIFSREGSKITFGTTLGDMRAKLEVLEEFTRPNALFLSAAARLNLSALVPVYSWFRSGLRVRGSSAHFSSFKLAREVHAFLEKRHDNRQRLISLLSAADVGIINIVVEESEDPNLSRLLADTETMIGTLTTLYKSAARKDQRELSRELAFLQEQRDSLRKRAVDRRPELRFAHGSGGELFDLDEESAGTRSWLALLPTVLDVLDEGDVVVVDEIDTSLHPLLTAQLVGLFQNPETNSRNAQLIFTTHDTSLMGTMIGNNALDREQVWFVQKTAEGASEIYPLTDFKPRTDQNIERRYLGGSYGAVPVLDDEAFVKAVRDR